MDRDDDTSDTGPGTGDDTIEVAGRWDYRWRGTPRPHVHPVRTPSGHVLTREAPPDHPWHHALWFTVKFVDGDNFWEEYDAFGTLVHDGPPTVTEGDGGRVEVRGVLRWVRPDGEAVALVEDRSLAHVPLDDEAYAIDLDTRLVPGDDCRLDRTPFTTWGGYGGLTVRGAGDWTDTRLLLDGGTVHERVLGDVGRWLDITGRPPGGSEAERAGIALLDHPANRRHPTPWYASTRADTYGDEGWSNFVNAAFLWHDGMDLTAGEELRVRHRVIVHDGDWSADRLDAAWADLV